MPRDTVTARAILAVLPQLKRVLETAAREQGMVSPQRARCLSQLANGPMRAGELAQMCLLTPPAATELVEGLVQDGLVRRETDETDRRVVRLAMTAAGRRAVERYHAAIADVLGEVVARMDPLARERLRLALRDLRAALDTEKETTYVR